MQSIPPACKKFPQRFSLMRFGNRGNAAYDSFSCANVVNFVWIMDVPIVSAKVRNTSRTFSAASLFRLITNFSEFSTRYLFGEQFSFLHNCTSLYFCCRTRSSVGYFHKSSKDKLLRSQSSMHKLTANSGDCVHQRLIPAQ